jgi:asparagine synthase (glutamine-hydrolysing)
MGGIIGAINPGESVNTTSALDLLKHRMPNVNDVCRLNNGFIQGDNSQGGGQPCIRGSYVLVGDFDIFNLDDLVLQLKIDNAIFDDTNLGDLLLAGLETWGNSLFDKIEGDFALAIYNNETEELLLARDKAGARPLYYSCIDNKIYFASEYKSIVYMLTDRPKLDLEIVQYLQSRKSVPADRTFYNEIYQVPAQHVITISSDGSINKSAYWTPRLDIHSYNLKEHSDKLRKVFLQAVKRRISTDKPIAISLSGGIDSIAILGAVRFLEPKRPIYTFTIGDSKDDHEIVWAEKVAKYYSTIHKSIIFTTETLKVLLPVLVWHLEDPIARTETLMCYILAKESSKVSDVILRGDGADGFFGGMPRHSLIAKIEKFPILKFIIDELYGFSQTGIIPDNPLTMPAFKLLLRRKIPAYPLVKGASIMKFEHMLPKASTEILNNLLVNGPKHALPMLLQKVDRVHAAFGVRGISPFLDSAVIEMVFQIPSILKNDGKRNKIVFREAVKPFVPEEFVNRPKHPQRIQEDLNFCDSLFSIASSLFNKESVNRRGIFYWDEIDRLMHRKKGIPWKPEHAMRIWTLILTELWFKTFIDKHSPTMVTIQ